MSPSYFSLSSSGPGGAPGRGAARWPRSPAPFLRRLCRRRSRGAAGILMVMFLAFFAVTISAGITVYSHHKTGWDRWRLAGQIWAEWVHALAEAPHPIPFTANWAGNWQAVVDNLYCRPSPCADRDATAAAAGLPTSGLGEDPTINLGIPVAGEAMHFSYVEVPPSPELPCPTTMPLEYSCDRVGVAMFRPDSLGRLDAIRRGTIDGGLGTLAVAGPGACSRGASVLRGIELLTTPAPSTPTDLTTTPEARLESRLPASWGGCFQEGDLVALVNVSIPHEERALHRLPPAGRPDLVSMEVNLDMANENMTVEGTPHPGPAAAGNFLQRSQNSRDVEAAAAQDIRAVDVQFRPSSTDVDAPGTAVRADFVALGSLTLSSPTLTRPHEIGASSATGDETLQIVDRGDFKTLEASCEDVGGADDCTTSLDLRTETVGSLNTAGRMEVRRETGTAVTRGSGVYVKRKTNAGRLEIQSGYCHGCERWAP